MGHGTYHAAHAADEEHDANGKRAVRGKSAGAASVIDECTSVVPRQYCDAEDYVAVNIERDAEENGGDDTGCREEEFVAIQSSLILRSRGLIRSRIVACICVYIDQQILRRCCLDS